MASRVLRRDGRFNIRSTVKRNLFNDTYHSLLAIGWRQFLLVYLAAFFSINLVFAAGYYALGPEGLDGISGSEFHRFLEAFFFSVQTFATIGYGKIGPHGLLANILVTFEAVAGLLSMAVGTGLVFSRFSKAKAKVIFTDKAIVRNIDGVPSLLLRIANERQNHVLEAAVSVVATLTETTREGETYRNFYDLKLERSKSPLFALTWTIVHPIDQTSPLYGKTRDDLRAANAEILVTFTGVDEIVLNTIYSRVSYTTDEILWNARFADVLSRSDDGEFSVNLDNFHVTENALKL